MFEIKGKYGTALCYAKVCEDEAVEQAGMQEIHRRDDKADVRGVLALGVGELLVGHHAQGRHLLRRASHDAHGGLLDAVGTDLGSQQSGGEVDVSCTVVGAYIGLPSLSVVGHLLVELPPVVRLVLKEDVLEQVGVVPEHDPFELSDQAVLEVPVHHGASFMISIAAGSLLE